MLKRIPVILLGLAFLMNSCQKGLDFESTATASTPTETVPSPTSTSESEPEPASTSRPDATGTAPPCFISSNEASPFAFMPDSARIVIMEGSGVRIFNLETMEEERFLQTPPLPGPGPIAISPNGETLAWALEDYTSQIVSIVDGQVPHTLEGHSLPITKLRFSPSGDHLYSASADTWVRIWDLDGELVDSFEPTGADNLVNEIQGIGISPDGHFLANHDNDDNKVYLSSLTETQEIQDLEGTQTFIYDLFFSPDGTLLASAGAEIQIWQVETGQLLYVGKDTCP